MVGTSEGEEEEEEEGSYAKYFQCFIVPLFPSIQHSARLGWHPPRDSRREGGRGEKGRKENMSSPLISFLLYKAGLRQRGRVQ